MVSDEEVSKLNINKKTVVEEVIIDGEKYYSYTGKEDFDRGVRQEPKTPTIKDGSILPRVNRPRRTAIKL